MDQAGWTRVDAVRALLGCGPAELDPVVTEDAKGRFQVDGDRVRACQGHSTAGTPVTVAALEAG